MIETLSNRLTDQHKALATKAVVVAMTVGLATQLALFTWDVIAPSKILLPTASMQSNSNNVSSGEADATDISRFHLFGIAGEEPVEQPTEAISAPVTRLRLTLQGVFANENMAQSSAIISEQGKSGEYYKVGDRVQGRTKLSAVYQDKVILDNNGKLETLMFEDFSKANQITQVSSNVRKPATAPKRAQGPKRNSTQERSLQDRLKKVKSPEEFVGFAKDTLKDDGAQALTELGLESAPDGYKVTNRAGMLKRLGLKAGDVILSINGSSLGDISSDVALIDQIYEEGSAEIEVRRGSRTFRINRKFK